MMSTNNAVNAAASVTGTDAVLNKAGGSSSHGLFGLRKVGKAIASKAKGIRDWVKPPGKSLKAWRILVLVGVGVGAICLGLAALKATALVLAGGALIGGGYLIYRCTRHNSAV